jgi:hypothetical protein
MRLFRLLPLICIMTLCNVASASSMTFVELRGWLSSTTEIMKQRSPNASGDLTSYVRVRGTDLEGYLEPASATHGFLTDGQEIVAIPLGSGGSMGDIAALVFTVVDGQRRFVGYLPSPNGHLEMAIRAGRLEQSTPIYGHKDGTCCPSHQRVQVFTLKGIRLEKVDDYVAGSR